MNETETQELKVYEVTNRETGEKHYSVSTNAQDACEQAGWQIGNCYVVEQKPKRSLDAETPSQLVVKIPCLTCPFQYAECIKPEEAECPIQHNAPELNEWLKQVTKAHLCPYVGVELKKKDYLLRQKWVTIEEAVRELAPKS